MQELESGFTNATIQFGKTMLSSDLKPAIHVVYEKEYDLTGHSGGSIAHFDEARHVWCQSSCHVAELAVMHTFPLALGGLEAVKNTYGIVDSIDLRTLAKIHPHDLKEMGSASHASDWTILKTVISYFSWYEYKEWKRAESIKHFFGEQLPNGIWSISLVNEADWLLEDLCMRWTTLQLLNQLQTLKAEDRSTLLYGGHIDVNSDRTAFISHSTKDKPLARRVAKALENTGVKVWIDEAEIKIGDSISQSLERGIENADYMVAILSEHSVNSKWVQEELRLALNLQISKSSMKILPVIIGDCEIPGFLKDKLYLDLRDNQAFDLGVQRLAREIREG